MSDLKLWPWILLLLPTLLQAAAHPPQLGYRYVTQRELPSGSEELMLRPDVQASHFGAVLRASDSNGCESTRPPEAIATPNPLRAAGADEPTVIVSFIVGTDGRVHSPLILIGSHADQDRLIIGALAHWRYRPATCNGAPTEVEGKVEFSRR
jgi:outer membrane biosynthesis protein TonB